MISQCTFLTESYESCNKKNENDFCIVLKCVSVLKQAQNLR